MKYYLNCILFLTHVALAVLPRKPALSRWYTQLLILHGDAVILRSVLMNIRLAAQLGLRNEIHAEPLQDEIIFWSAFKLAFRMHSNGLKHKLIGRCLRHIQRESEIVLPASWRNGWRSGKLDAESEQMAHRTASDYPGLTDLSEVHRD